MLLLPFVLFVDWLQKIDNKRHGQGWAGAFVGRMGRERVGLNAQLGAEWFSAAFGYWMGRWVGGSGLGIEVEGTLDVVCLEPGWLASGEGLDCVVFYLGGFFFFAAFVKKGLRLLRGWRTGGGNWKKGVLGDGKVSWV